MRQDGNQTTRGACNWQRMRWLITTSCSGFCEENLRIRAIQSLQPGSLRFHRAALPSESGNAARHRPHVLGRWNPHKKPPLRVNRRMRSNHLDSALDIAQKLSGASGISRFAMQSPPGTRVGCRACAEANGRQFLHQLDDVKDHVPDRTVDMTYLVDRELQSAVRRVGQRDSRRRAINMPRAHQLPEDSSAFDWHD